MSEWVLSIDGMMLTWDSRNSLLGQKLLSVPLYPPQIPHGLAGLGGDGPAINRLSLARPVHFNVKYYLS
jgi:hypothetical protein